MRSSPSGSGKSNAGNLLFFNSHKERDVMKVKILEQKGLLALLVSVVSTSAIADIGTYGQAVAAALETNPTVVSAYYQFEAARESQKSRVGDLAPRVDLNADYAWAERATPLNDFGSYDSDSIRFTVTQLLFDGFQTWNEVRSLGYEKLARYYDFHAAAQDIALQATIAYADTVLYQKLVGYAEENYVVHRQVSSKIAERVAAGRDEGVNLEQATARMALAESNLLTEVTNLYDTRAEFQRVVGELPVDQLPMPTISTSMMPGLREEALRVAYSQSPDVNRTIEEMRSAREAYDATRGPMLPRLDLRYRNETETNIDGIRGDYDLNAVELVFTYNLFRGGGDSARRREFSNRYYAAVENRKEACLAVRREVMIAFNNVEALEQQERYLTLQLEAQDKTRRAYNDQFDRNQRTLLDLLDSQNEYFDTQRALAAATVNLFKAKATVLAETGVLTDTLDVRGFNESKLNQVAQELERGEDEEILVCSPGVVPTISIDQEAIFDRLNARAEKAGAVE
jgi:adhesin transport system outer membrane protein